LNPDAENLLIANKSHLERRQLGLENWIGPEPVLGDFGDGANKNGRKKRVILGYLEAFVLARAAAFCVCHRSTCNSYFRYFSEEDAEWVLKILSYIIGPEGLGPYEVEYDPDWPLRILYGDRPQGGFPDNECDDGKTTSIFSNVPPDRQGALLVICPYLFTFARPCLDRDCDSLPAVLEETLQTIGSAILHELLHWDLIIQRSTRNKLPSILDYPEDEDGKPHTDPANSGYPPDGYGSFNAYWLNRFRVPQFGHFKTPLRNADSFTLLALEAYYHFKCPGHVWSDPTVPPPPPRDKPSIPKDIVVDHDPVPGEAQPPPEPPGAEVSDAFPAAEKYIPG
jgi:hypothetical protein